MGAADFYKNLGLEPVELLNGETVHQYAFRVTGAHVHSTTKKNVRYSYGTEPNAVRGSQSATSKKLYSY